MKKCPKDCIAEQKSLSVKCLGLSTIEKVGKYHIFNCQIQWGNGIYSKKRVYHKNIALWEHNMFNLKA